MYANRYSSKSNLVFKTCTVIGIYSYEAKTIFVENYLMSELSIMHGPISDVIMIVDAMIKDVHSSVSVAVMTKM